MDEDSIPSIIDMDAPVVGLEGALGKGVIVQMSSHLLPILSILGVDIGDFPWGVVTVGLTQGDPLCAPLLHDRSILEGDLEIIVDEREPRGESICSSEDARHLLLADLEWTVDLFCLH